MPNNQPLVLRPRYNPLIGSFLHDETLINQILTTCGSPVNVLFPQAIASNVDSFKSVLKEHQVNGSIFFAHKANQSLSLLRQLAVSDVNCDVASTEELRHALACGFAGNRLEATGPKNVEFLQLCLLHGVTLNIDSQQELNDLIQIKKALSVSKKSRILLRLSNFKFGNPFYPPPNKQSRFGIAFTQLEHVLKTVVVPNQEHLDLLGFSFHLDSTSIEERIEVLQYCETAFETALNLGLSPRVLNIGGGFGINYLSFEEDWNRYVNAIKESALGARKDITWNNNHFGLHSDSGQIRGSLNTYNYFNPLPGSAFLNELLDSKLRPFHTFTIGQWLRSNEIELWLEPGRALLDLAGITLASVNSIKGVDNNILGLDMKRQDIAFLDQEIFVDPILLRKFRVSIPKKQQYQGYYLAGNLCLENDMIFRRKVFLPIVPHVGDIFAFINTAAYMMDFSATNSIMQGQAMKVAAVYGNDFTWMFDDKYTPLWDFYNR